MTEAEIQAQMDAICAASIERGFMKPSAWYQMKSGGGGFYSIDLHLDENERVSEANFVNNAENGVKAMWEWFNELEDPHIQKQREAVRDLGRSIDKLRASGIDADFVDPLSETFREMNKLLLPAPKQPVEEEMPF